MYCTVVYSTVLYQGLGDARGDGRGGLRVIHRLLLCVQEQNMEPEEVKILCTGLLINLSFLVANFTNKIHLCLFINPKVPLFAGSTAWQVRRGGLCAAWPLTLGAGGYWSTPPTQPTLLRSASR